MEKPRMGEGEREEKILMLLNRLPGRFSIKEISDIYDSIDSQSLNRNSLRKTLSKLVENNKINCTRDGSSTKGHGAYFGLSSNDFFRRIAKSLPQVEEIAKNVGSSFVETSFQDIIDDIKLGECNHETVQDVSNHIKHSYPFIDFSFADEKRSISVSTKIQVDLPEDKLHLAEKGYDPRDMERKFLIAINKCLCEGKANEDETIINACHMVSGTIESSVIEECGFKASVSKLHTDEHNVCHFSYTLQKLVADSGPVKKKKDPMIPI